MARGTVVGWAPQRDTGSARMRWWGTAGSLLPGVAQGQAESPPARRPPGPGAIETGGRRNDVTFPRTRRV